MLGISVFGFVLCFFSWRIFSVDLEGERKSLLLEDQQAVSHLLTIGSRLM